MKKLVLIGTGPHHVHLLLSLTQQALEGVQVTLVAPSLRQLYSPMMADFVAGLVTLEDCLIDLEPRLKNSGIRYLPLGLAALDAPAQTLTLSDGSTLAFDWLSINQGDVMDRAQLELQVPGVRQHGLFLYPSNALAKLWPSVLSLAETRPLRVAVLGDNLQSIEVALAVRHRLPSASITLVLNSTALAHQGHTTFQARITQALKQSQITVLEDHAVSLTAGQVMLGCGAGLVCDVPIVALGATAPGWLASCRLALNDHGFMDTDEQQCSRSQPCIFSADEGVAFRPTTVWRRRGVQAAAEMAYAQHLISGIRGLPKRVGPAPEKSFALMALGGHIALASWKQYSAQGRWLWRLKNWIDRASVQRLRQP